MARLIYNSFNTYLLNNFFFCNGVNYKREREKLLEVNLQKYLSVNQFGVLVARE